MKPFIGTCCVLLFVIGFAPYTRGQQNASPSPSFSIRSETLQREYPIRVHCPETKADGLLPVLYVLDGQWEFEMVSNIYGALRQDGFVPEAVLVGICIPGTDEERRAIRSQDFAPESPNSDGHAKRFREFLCNSILPEVEQRFPCDPANRTLVGWSMGGMFSIETMLSDPGRFRNFAAISPALFWDQGHARKRLQKIDFVKPTQPVNLWMSMGQLEPPYFQDAFREFQQELDSAKLPGVQCRTSEVEAMRHFSARPIAYAKCLKELFAPPPIELSEEAMKAVCGTYRPVDNAWAWWGDVEIELSDGRLWAARRFPGFEGRDALTPVAPNVFLGTRYGSRFSMIERTGKRLLQLKWEEFPSIDLKPVQP